MQVSWHRRKREKQWERWQREVILKLIGPYMELMCTMKSLCDAVPLIEKVCTCGEHGRKLEVVLVCFDFLERISIAICACRPAAMQLLVHGCCPSAPLAPTLAVDLKVLDFVTSLFVNIAPNNTAWCKTVETFLSKQGYKLTTQVRAELSLTYITRDIDYLKGFFVQEIQKCTSVVQCITGRYYTTR
ncbi:hypothetical protein Hypma_010173 [Hypsizygus marmoreus]|uniref:CxC1-like cysteine cluster associated with KDZ transposases domain-containing protein n=1 Tax=Hypsizygus marmoreus TaxID=39966 RepID=A0A369JJR6_HYPMA|nr:hypothetical protein Hypma_010173 [Hypsizygus marmoreus]